MRARPKRPTAIPRPAYREAAAEARESRSRIRVPDAGSDRTLSEAGASPARRVLVLIKKRGMSGECQPPPSGSRTSNGISCQPTPHFLVKSANICVFGKKALALFSRFYHFSGQLESTPPAVRNADRPAGVPFIARVESRLRYKIPI